MHQVQFDKYHGSADLLSILALWHELVGEWRPQADPMRATIPRGPAKDRLATYLRAGERACRFDVILRLASGRVDAMHATVPFFGRGDNGHWFAPVREPARDSRRVIECVRLTEAAIAAWDASGEAREQAIADARALLESDIESEGVIVALLPERERQAPAPLSASGVLTDADRRAHLEALVRRIHEEPWQPVFRRKPFGAPVTGWDARLLAYFWPGPDQGYARTCAAVDALAEQAQGLALALGWNGGWNEDEGAAAVELAHAIFTWGGVPQDPATVTPESVQQVFEAALADDAASRANMNSGWTKLAAFVTAHGEGDPAFRPQVIWDSRVAASITSRLDAQLPEGVLPASLFAGIGTVPGRGGTRPRKLSRSWPSGYRTWAGQVAGSALVRELRDILNGGGYPAMPLPEGGAGPWTTRGVEMVLFMDGY
jgi:hypothetical protein